MTPLFIKSKVILNRLHQNGYEAYIVGGAVRDFYLNKPINDIDIATSASPFIVQELFEETIPVGIEHGTVIVRYDNESFEVTTFRTESRYEDFRHPSEVSFVRSLNEDLKRRDFTMNAMALTVEGLYIDPFGGREDLSKGILRAVGNPIERFSEDPLRMMRAFRFVSQLNLSLDEDVFYAVKNSASLIKKISIERIQKELNKLLIAPWVNRAFIEMVKTEFLFFLDFFDTSEERINKLITSSFDCLDTLEEKWTFIIITLNIEEKYFFKQWRFSSLEKTKIKQLKAISKDMIYKQWDLYSLYKYGVDNACAATRVMSLMSSLHNLNEVNCLVAMAQTLPIKDRSEINFSGYDVLELIEKPSGPWVEQVLQAVEKQIVNGKLINNKQEIRRWVNKWYRYNNNF